MLVKVKCIYCGLIFERSECEVKRSNLLNRRLFCSRRCCGLATNDKDSIKKRIPYKKSIEGSNKANLKRSLDPSNKFRYYIHIVRNRYKRICNISVDDLRLQWEKQNGICPYTGIELILPLSTGGFKDKANKLYNASLDRINSSKAYQADNIQFVSRMANLAKNDVDHEIMECFCKIIAKKWREV